MTRFCSAVLAMALVVGLPAAASSQLSFGVTGGLNIATFGGADAPDDLDARVGMVVGALANYRLSDLLSIQPELLYSQKGASASEEFFGETIDLTFKLDYVEIPVMLRFAVPTAGRIQPSFHVGPTAAFEVSCKVSFSAFGESGTEGCDDDEFDDEPLDRRKFDPGLGVGGGLAIPVGRGSLLLEARYTLGLRSLSADEDLRNRVLSLNALFRFN